MKKTLSFLLFCAAFCLAQGVSDIGKIALSVVVPDIIEELDDSQKSKLEAKITQITNAAGLAADGYDQSFVIYPKFTIYQTDVVETGMQNLTKVTAELSLYIKQVANNVLFTSTSRQLVGTGKTKSEAITNAIQKLPAKDAELTAFIEKGKQKIVQYYESKCGDIIAKAEGLVKRREYENAIFELLAVPEECSACYAKVSIKATEAFEAYQDKVCAEQIRDAKTKLAAKNYRGTLDILSKINPSAKCFSEAQTMIRDVINQECFQQLQIAKSKTAGKDFDGALQALESINPIANCYTEAVDLLDSVEKMVDEKERKEWKLRMRLYNDAKAAEQRNFEAAQEQRRTNNDLTAQSIQAAKEISIAKAKNQPRTIVRDVNWW